MIRPYTPEDSNPLRAMLLAEGLNHDDMGFATGNTFVYNDDGTVKGFYTYRMDCDIFPHITHFCVDERYRGMGRIAYRLVRDFTKRIGVGKAIIHAKNEKISRLVEHYFNVSPYSDSGKHKFYLVEMNNG